MPAAVYGLESGAAQQAREQVALCLKERRQSGPGVGAFAKIARHRVLQRRDDAEGVELVDLAKFAGQQRRRHAVADSPAGRVQGFPEGEDREAALAQFRMRQHRAVTASIEEHVFIHFIGEQGDRPVVDQRGERRPDLACRPPLQRWDFAGAVDDDQAGAVGERGAHLIPVESKHRRRQRDAHAACAGQAHGGLVGVVGGVKNDDFIAGPHHGLDGIVQGFQCRRRSR